VIAVASTSTPVRTRPPRPAGPAGASAGSRRKPRRPAVVRWPLSVMLLVLLLAGCTALGPLLAGSAWWWVLLVVAAVVLAAAAGFRRVRVPVALVPFLSAGVLVIVLTLFFGAGTGLFWVIPTGDTVTGFVDQARSGILSIQTQDTPAEVQGGILFLLAVGVGLLAIVMDTLAIGLRWPALAGIPVLVPILTPGFVVPDGAGWTVLVATAVAYLVLLRVEVRLRPAPATERGTPVGLGSQGAGAALRGAVSIAALGIVAALVVSASVPHYAGTGTGGRTNGALFGSGITPMIDLGEDLRRPAPGPALHYRTTASDQPYFALLTLDDIRGTTWLPRVVPVDPDKTVDAIDEPPGLSADVARTSATTYVGIDGVRSDMLPVPVPATSVAGVSGDWFWNNGTRSITSRNSTTASQRYTVTSLELQPTREQLRQAVGRYPSGIEPSRELPENTPAIIEETARAVTAGTESNYDAAVALQDYLRGSDFTYDTEAPVEDDYDGGGADVIGTFLEAKRGYCVHFSSAMAMMARSLDIPSRITLGYLPGTRTTTVIGGLNRYDVDSHDLHAWPELYFVGVGWVPFEPTPGRGTVPDYALPESSVVPGQPAGGAAPSAAPQTNTADGLTPDAVGSGLPAEEDAVSVLGRVSLSALGVVLVLLIPGVWRLVRRRRRRAQLADGRADASLAWQELADTAVDHGVPAFDTATARELSADIGARRGVGDTPEVRDALDRLLLATERARYARSPAPETAGAAALLPDLDVVVRALQSGSSVPSRLRAVLAPRSLSSPILRRMGLAREAAEAPASPGNDRTPAGA
jgi:transglutaminase-like putative cysteine protease